LFIVKESDTELIESEAEIKFSVKEVTQQKHFVKVIPEEN
jgi:hypothetical protein